MAEPLQSPRAALARLGWSEALESAFAAFAASGLSPARVASAQREHYRIWAEDGSSNALCSGKLRFGAARGELPVVGDWVLVDRSDGGTTIHGVLPRAGALVRHKETRGRTQVPQVLVANVDRVFFLSSLNRDWNPRRFERALSMIKSAGVAPVLLLTKLDLCADPAPAFEAAREIAADVPCHALSVKDGSGLSVLDRYLAPGKTITLMGTSGVGKSTLLNHLMGTEHAAVGAIRESDDRGRHTTTHRELYSLPSGALLIDTPGMREFGVAEVEPPAPRRGGRK